MRRLGLLLLLALGAAFAQEGFTLTSPEIADGGSLELRHVYNGFGCSGENRSPELAWSGAPEGTQSFAVTVYDPDAPTGSGWWHWVIFDIPAEVTSLPAGAGDPASGLAPEDSVQSNTDFGTPGYGGPCPPEGDAPHHYVFTVFALDVPSLELPETASGALVGFNLHAHALAQAQLTATYGR